MQPPPMEKLSFSFLDEDGLADSLLQVGQFEDVLNSDEMSFSDQADEALKNCSLSENDYDYVKDLIGKEYSQSSQTAYEHLAYQ